MRRSGIAGWAAVFGGALLACAALFPAAAQATFPGRDGTFVIALNSTRSAREALVGVRSGGAPRTLMSCDGDGDSCPFAIGDPSVSPNGHLIAFDGLMYTDSYTTNSEIAVYSLTTRKLKLAPFIEAGSDNDTGPAWFPGSDRLIFSASGELGSGPNNGTWLYSETPTGKQVTQLISCGCSLPAVAPNGQTVLFDHGSQVWQMNADGSDPHMLLTGAEPSWGPSGLRYAFTRAGNIYVTALDSAHAQLVARHATDPVFSPEGDSVAYASTKHGVLKIYTVAATGGRSYLRFEQKLAHESFTGFDWQSLG